MRLRVIRECFSKFQHSLQGGCLEPKLLLCDIGNTAIKLGFASEQKVLATYALPVNREVTGDSLGLSLLALCGHAAIQKEILEAAVVSSVVPALDAIFKEAVKRFLNIPVLFAAQDLPVPLENQYKEPREVGADRLVGAYAARRFYPDAPSLIVVDYGTAVTFDCVFKQAYLGGLIFPGPATAAGALARHTAKLPDVSLETGALGPSPRTDTATSIQHGLIFGYVAMTEGLCDKLRAQMEEPVTILATGGFATTIARLSKVFDNVLPALLLEGLRQLYYNDKL